VNFNLITRSSRFMSIRHPFDKRAALACLAAATSSASTQANGQPNERASLLKIDSMQASGNDMQFTFRIVVW
jgi:hypothetical protein